MSDRLKLKLLGRSSLKGKVGAHFPASVTATSPVVINQAGNSYSFSIDLDALEGMLPGIGGAFYELAIALTDGATVPLNASLGNLYYLVAAGDRTILAPDNPPASGHTQKLIIRHLASGANRTLTLTTGSAGAFRFGSTLTGLTVTLNGKTDYIGCLWNSSDSRWDVVAYSKGY